MLSVVGDAYIQGARILAVLWEGATASGDTATLRHRLDGDLLWAGRTDSTQTYQGVNLGPSGIHAPKGFQLTQLSAGRILVYLREEI